MKAATSDTTLPAGSFLFGADSQAATAPSVYPINGVASYGPYIGPRTPTHLRYFTYKLNRLYSQGERPRINMYGDSITQGAGAGANSGLMRYAIGQQMADGWLDRGGQEAMPVTAAGYYHDTVHPSALGYRDLARFLVDGILWSYG